MWRSASRSRWPVETPGFSSASTRARTSATIRPAWRIFSISRRDLRVTMAGSPAGGAVCGTDDVTPSTSSIGWRPSTIRRIAAAAVVVDDLVERRRSAGRSGPDRVLAVVGALDERRPVEVADARHAGRVRDEVVDVAVRRADPRFAIRATRVLGRQVDEIAWSTRRPASASASSSASAWTARPGEAVEDRAAAGVVGWSSRSRNTPTIVVVGHELAAVHVPLGLAAERACRAATAARSRSPDARTGMPRCSARIGAWVPLPAPGAPRSTITVIGLPDEPFVVAHQELRLDLLHRLDDDADDDQEAGAAEGDRPVSDGTSRPTTDGAVATMPRNSAPAIVIRVTTRAR